MTADMQCPHQYTHLIILFPHTATMAQFEVLTEVIEAPPGWKQTIHEYLAKHNFRCQKATPLQGGASAYVWRIEGLTINGCKPQTQRASYADEVVITNYGGNTAKGAANLEMAPERMQFEARAMNSTVVAQACSQEPAVEVPWVVGSTNEAVMMSWAGDIDLRSAYIKDPTLDAVYVGTSLGRWLACMHLAGINNVEIKDWTNSTAETFQALERTNMRHQLSTVPDFSPEEIDGAVTIHDSIASVWTLTA